MKKLRTTITALVTPFSRGEVDFQSLEVLVDQQLKGGVGGFVINGTTAESPTLESLEVEKIFAYVRKIVGKDFLLILGTGSNSTKATLDNTKKAKNIGADAALVVVPYYNKPPQRGLVAHFTTVATKSEFPVILYNVPSRTITSLSIESIVELSKVPNIIGIKEASGNIEFAGEILSRCSSDFSLLSGDDFTYPDFLKIGGHGVISVASHVIPSQFVTLLNSSGQDRNFLRYKTLIEFLFLEANPIPVKKALQYMGIINSAELRLPLDEMDFAMAEKLKIEMRTVGLLK
jgi:4-hydroxy-tetrahydrodipicolinate synthase